MGGAVARLDALLRAEGRHAVGSARVPWGELFLVVIFASSVYGAVMGSWSARALQVLFSALKVPMLIGVSAVICAPSFAVVNTVLGLREDLAAATRGIVASQATVALTLTALAPVTAVANLSIQGYEAVLLFNGLQFALATVAGHVTLTRHYRPLISRNPRHRVGRLAWLLLYVFVAIQMAWVLRPFIGSPQAETTFFREDAWSNAYIRVLDLVIGRFVSS